MKERRAFQRTSVELPAYYSLDGDDELTHQATVINVSAGGFCFYAQQSLPSGSHVTLNVEIEKGDELTFRAVTAWAKKIGDTGDHMIGVQIDQTEGSDVEKFLKYYCKEISQFISELQSIKEN